MPWQLVFPPVQLRDPGIHLWSAPEKGDTDRVTKVAHRMMPSHPPRAGTHQRGDRGHNGDTPTRPMSSVWAY